MSSPKKFQTFMFDAETVSSDYEVTATAWYRGKLIRTMKIRCPTAPYCETLGCAWCWRLVTNSPCAPYFFAVALALYIVALCLLLVGTLVGVAGSIYLLVRATRKLLSCSLYGRKTSPNLQLAVPKFIRKLKSKKPTVKKLRARAQPLAEESSSSRTSYLPLFSPSRALMVAMVLALQLRTGSTCAETHTFSASEDQCQLSVDNIMKCVFNNITVVNILPKGQEICFIALDRSNRPVGHLKLRAEDVEYACDPSTHFFSREVEFRDVSSKRCEGKGSCIANACVKTSWSSKIFELGSLANEHPGYTFCTESCGGWSCSCFWPTPGCLFYRYFAVPKGLSIYEVFSCDRWIPKLKIRASWTNNAGEENHSFELGLLKSESWNGIKITLTQLTVPPQHTDLKFFISDGELTGHLTEEAVKAIKFRCKTLEQAMNFNNCTFPHDVCTATPAVDYADIQCDEISIAHWLKDENLLPYLPKSEEQAFLKAEGKHVWYKPELVAAQIQLATSFHLRTQSEANACKMETATLVGCHSCSRGATFTYRCSTTFGDALAHARCENAEFPVLCNANKTQRETQLYYSYSEVLDKCTLICPTSTDAFEIKAQLQFIGHEDIQRHATQKNSPYFAPPVEIWQALLELVDAPKRAVVFLVSMVGLLLGIYLLFALIRCMAQLRVARVCIRR